MFVRYFVELPLRLADAEGALLGAPARWLPALAEHAVADGEALLAEAGIGQGRNRCGRVAVVLGPVVHRPLRMILAMTWGPTDAQAPLLELDADLELGALGTERTQLSISGRCRPALGTVGLAVDRAVLRGVAEATVKTFLDAVGQEIQCLAAARP